MLPEGPAPALEEGQSLAGLIGAASPGEEVARVRSHEEHSLPAPTGERSLAARSAVRSLAEAIDVAFLVVHGPFGEDGTLQGFLDWRASRTPGPGCWRARWRWTRSSSRTSCAATGCPRRLRVVPARHVAASRTPRAARDRRSHRPGGGRQAGAARQQRRDVACPLADELPRRSTRPSVTTARPSSRPMSPGPASSSAASSAPVTRSSSSPGRCGESHELYDYEAKYVAGPRQRRAARRHRPPDLAGQPKELALASYRAVDGAGLARLDFLVQPVTRSTSAR